MRLASLLFAPGDSERKCAKALASAADAVILDLEDAVAPAAKEAARAAVLAVLASASRPGVVVRVNPPGTPWYLADLAAVVPQRPAAIMLPKCTGAADLIALGHHLEALEASAGLPPGAVGVLPIVTESAAAVLALPSCAQAAERVLGFCFGAEDLSADLGIDPRRADASYPPPVAAARAAVVTVAAAASRPAIDTPWPDPRDFAGLRREAQQAAADGFAGKLCIHPDQIAVVAAAFRPSPERLAWARRVRDGFAANPGGGVFVLDGKMIDRPHLRLAERILAAADE